MNHPSVYISYPTLYTPLGLGLAENFNLIRSGQSGLKIIDNPELLPEAFSASCFSEEELNQGDFPLLTRFEKILGKGLDELIRSSGIDASSPDTLIVLATTKGNIELLELNDRDPRLGLSYTAKWIQNKLSNPNETIVVSNACISGISASIVAKRLLQSGAYKHALVLGCDAISSFVLSGFNSFKALDKTFCKPFDLNRNGVNLGEGFAGYLLSTQHSSNYILETGFISNDANHISGPSKTGEELHHCIQSCFQASATTPQDIDFIAAHGTATPYNDEMEAKAIALSGLHQTPVFSLKGIFGHTLGAAALLETIIGIRCLEENIILPSAGFTQLGVSVLVNINTQTVHKTLHRFLKTGSGFGGCNGAIMVRKK